MSIEKLWEITTSLSNETFEAAKTKCLELKIDIDKGKIPFQETIGNLSHVRDLILDSIKKEKLVQLPITIQEQLITKLTNISTLLTEMVNGKDNVEAFVKNVEDVYFSTWQYALHNLSDEYLGYQTKVNAVKKLENEILTLNKELQDGLRIKTEITAIQGNITQLEKAVSEALEKANENALKAQNALGEVTKFHSEANSKLNAIHDYSESAEKNLASINENKIAVENLTASIKEFQESILDSTKIMDQAKTDSQQTVTDNNQKTETLIQKLSDLEKQIELQIQKATGFSLFDSFQRRKEAVVKTKWGWACGVLLTLVLIAWLTFELASMISDSKNMSLTPFYLKLSIYGPLLFSLIFCTKNYSHERRLEEEYAFKANISVSLVPYKELVENAKGDKEKYADFLIETITNVFASPTDKVFSHKDEELPIFKKANTKKYLKLAKEVSEIWKNVKPGVQVK